jgi:hypothetical protein
MSSGKSRPGPVNTRGNSESELTLDRGDHYQSRQISEPLNESSHLGLWEPKRELVNLDSARVKLASRALALLALFILVGIGSITWVTLVGKSGAELEIFLEVVCTPLFGLVMLAVGYFFGQVAKTKRHLDV